LTASNKFSSNHSWSHLIIELARHIVRGEGIDDDDDDDDDMANQGIKEPK